MYRLHLDEWSTADANGPRDQFHRTALHEARVATERNPGLARPATRSVGLVGRIRAAFAPQNEVAAEACACAA
jgi:hypothetical protein